MALARGVIPTRIILRAQAGSQTKIPVQRMCVPQVRARFVRAKLGEEDSAACFKPPSNCAYFSTNFFKTGSAREFTVTFASSPSPPLPVNRPSPYLGCCLTFNPHGNRACPKAAQPQSSAGKLLPPRSKTWQYCQSSCNSAKAAPSANPERRQHPEPSPRRILCRTLILILIRIMSSLAIIRSRPPRGSIPTGAIRIRRLFSIRRTLSIS